MIVNSGLPSYLTQQQVRKLFTTITNLRDRALFSLAYAYGLRVGEVVLLDRDDIDLERARIRIKRLKGGLSGERPIFRNLLPLLRQYLESRTDHVDALFVGLKERLKKRRIQELFGVYAMKADLPPDRRHVHVLRHSAAVHVLDAGEDIDFARDHLGHRSIQSTMTYAQISDARRNRKIRRLERSREFPIPS
jgi:type 1 fimbriae regulatory protein FimB